MAQVFLELVKVSNTCMFHVIIGIELFGTLLENRGLLQSEKTPTIEKSKKGMQNHLRYMSKPIHSSPINRCTCKNTKPAGNINNPSKMSMLAQMWVNQPSCRTTKANRSQNVLVQNCTFNHSGSGIDPRMWNRGSGMWTFKCKNVIAQHNNFLNCHGPQDSYSCHIDYGNENVVFQYNYSYNNEGGFVEILGDNINCGYRYNISVNDGYREDPNNTPWDKKGKIFWVSNFCGSGSIRCPSSGSFIYNNTVFVNDSINPEIYFWPNIGDILMYNNIVYVGSSGQVLPTLIQNNLNTLDISHNLFYDSARIDLDTDLINNALWGDPALLNPSMLGVDDPFMYQIQSQSPVIGMGKLISGSSDPLNFLQNNGGMDYFGNLVSSTVSPNIGASNHLNTLIENQSKKNKVIAYPTFTIDEVSLKIEGFNGDLSTKIYGTNGKLISTQKGEMISMKKYKKGIYILEVHYNDQMERIKVLKL